MQVWRMRTGISIFLKPVDRRRLSTVVRDRNAPHKHVWRAEIVLLSADGVGTNEIMRRTGKSKTCVWRWQERFMQAGYDGLLRDKTRPSRIPPLGSDIAERVVVLTQTDPPAEATHWTATMMAKAVGISASSVQRIWRTHGLQPHRVHQFKLSNDPRFIDKLREVVGLYVDPPAHAIVLSVDEKSQIQALDRTQPGLPMKKGRAGTPGRRRLLRRWLRARPAPEKKTTYQWERRSAQGRDRMNTVRLIFIGVLLLPWPAGGQEHRFEADPIVVVRENFVACDVLSQLQRVMENPRFLLGGECEPLRAGDQVRVYAKRGPYFCIYPHDRTSPCKWTHEKALSK